MKNRKDKKVKRKVRQTVDMKNYQKLETLFDRYYRGPTHYYPGDTFDYEFEDCEADEDTKHALKKLFQKDRIIMERSLVL